VTDWTLRPELGPRIYKIHAWHTTEFASKASGLIWREVHPRLPPSVESVPYIGRRQGLLARPLPVVGCDAAGPGFGLELATSALGSVGAICAVEPRRARGGLQKALAVATNAMLRCIDGQGLTFVAHGS